VEKRRESGHSGMLRTWYSDDNTIVRQKMSAQSIKGTASILEPIIRQGMQEGVFSTRYPEQVAETIAGSRMAWRTAWWG